MNRKSLAWLVCLLLASGSRAHEFWLEPSRFVVEAGEPVAIDLRVGEPFRGRTFPRDASHLRRFELLEAPAGAPSTVAGREGVAPAGLARKAGPGLGVLVYESRGVAHEMSADAFRDYLRHEGIPLPAGSGEADSSPRPIREEYHRFARALVAGGDTAGARDFPVGLRFEIVVLGNPYDHPEGEPLRLELRHRGTPLAGAAVKAVRRESPEIVRRLRSDESGRVEIQDARPGTWLITSIRLTPSERPEFDWRSDWASLTFAVVEEGQAPAYDPN